MLSFTSRGWQPNSGLRRGSVSKEKVLYTLCLLCLWAGSPAVQDKSVAQHRFCQNTLAKLFETISQPRTTMVLSQSLWCLVSRSKPDLNAAQFLMQLACPSLANRERFTDLAADGAWI